MIGGVPMTRNKMTLSIVALVGSVLLFIGSTFAWFVYQRFVDVQNSGFTIINIEAVAGLEISSDGIEYDAISSVETENKVPGEVVFYRLQIQNSGNTEISIRIRFFGFIDSVANPLKDDSNFQNGKSLVEVLYIEASNDTNSTVFNSQLISTALGDLPPGTTNATASIVLFDNIVVPVGEIMIIVFSLTMSPEAGNDYQNLKLAIDSIIIEAVAE
jgi:hypothetical protein